VLDELRLRPPRLEDEAVALLADAELEADGFPFLLGWAQGDSWSVYVETKRANAHGQLLPAGWVPNTFLLAEFRGEVIGRVSVRHRLNDELLHEGGHIGLCIRPRQRRQGLGGLVLDQGLIVARSVGVDRALVTCDDDNIASARMIERAGGALENVVTPLEGSTPVRRYWID